MKFPGYNGRDIEIKDAYTKQLVREPVPHKALAADLLGFKNAATLHHYIR